MRSKSAYVSGHFKAGKRKLKKAEVEAAVRAVLDPVASDPTIKIYSEKWLAALEKAAEIRRNAA